MSNIVILGDTNVAYNLYFFISQNIIPSKHIVIGVDVFQFHPVVLEEVEAHTQAWITSQELNYVDEYLPSFFDAIKKDGILKICKFVEANLATVTLVNTDSESFVSQRKIYEAARIILQAEMKKNGDKGKKIDSIPSLNDYKILYSAQSQKFKISTNDGILLEISKEILEPHNALKTEGILNLILKADPNKRANIEETLKSLSYLGRNLNRSEIFN